MRVANLYEKSEQNPLCLSWINSHEGVIACRGIRATIANLQHYRCPAAEGIQICVLFYSLLWQVFGSPC